MTASEEYYRIEAIKFMLSKGYPKENFYIESVLKRFGRDNRNSFRCDFVILDTRLDSLESHDIDTILQHTIVLAEIKRDNAKEDYVKNTQVKPMLDFSKNLDSVAVYWDNLNQRVFWQVMVGNKKEEKEGPLSFFPSYGNRIKIKPITYKDLHITDNLSEIFNKIENVLHQASFTPQKRYEIILQLLLAKIFDEHEFETRKNLPLHTQDFLALGTTPQNAKHEFDNLVRRAVEYYQQHLPNPVPETMDIRPDTLCEILKILAPILITHSNRDVMQTFYMKFAKDMYKWDLAQYFTPTPATDFIVRLINPQFGEHIADPACGSADFLVAAFRIGREYNPGFADCIWGVDNSDNAVQIAVLNMVLNGDGKSNIKKLDSLEHVNDFSERYNIILCDPPFGSKIIEKRKDVLAKFDLGHDPFTFANMEDNSHPILDSQETGILFAEVCVKECKKGGRIAIILPNGYLGNISSKFTYLREWLLKNTKICAIVGLPRFTFKSSGADVSASIIYLEKREYPLKDIKEVEPYPIAVEMVEKVGWEAGNKKATPVYIRNPSNGHIVTDEFGVPVLDCDFDSIIDRIRNSRAAEYFPWLVEGKAIDEGTPVGWTIQSTEVINDDYFTLDPKRYCKKVMVYRDYLKSRNAVSLGEIVEFIPEKTSSNGTSIKKKIDKEYHYIELQNIGFGDYSTVDMLGWELPGRAKHFAEPDDIYFGSIWGSAIKWCYIPQNEKNIVVTNGCFRCRIKEGKEEYLPDLLAYMNTEGWGVQMRSFARGSDGLATISELDASKVLIPILNKEDREKVNVIVNNLKEGHMTLKTLVQSLIKESDDYVDLPKRPSHIVLV